MNTRYLFALLLFILPFTSFAQVPKAYENEYYGGTLQGHKIKFALANGYISYSKVQLYIHKKPVVFEADSGAPDEHNQIKFVTYPPGKQGYFILDNMQDAYDDVPASFKGRYFISGNIIPVKLVKLHSSH